MDLKTIKRKKLQATGKCVDAAKTAIDNALLYTEHYEAQELLSNMKLMAEQVQAIIDAEQLATVEEALQCSVQTVEPK